MKTSKGKKTRWHIARQYVKKVCELALAELLSAAIVGGIYMGIHATQGGDGIAQRCMGKVGPDVDRVTLTFCIDRREDVSKVFAEVGRQMEGWMHEQQNSRR